MNELFLSTVRLVGKEIFSVKVCCAEHHRGLARVLGIPGHRV